MRLFENAACALASEESFWQRIATCSMFDRNLDVKSAVAGLWRNSNLKFAKGNKAPVIRQYTDFTRDNTWVHRGLGMLLSTGN